MTTIDEWARPIVLDALWLELGRNPYASEVYAVSAVARLETVYGSAWKGVGIGSNNWGAMQCGSKWTGDAFTYTDTHPNADGSNTPYKVGFRKYATPLEGARDLVRLMLRMGVIGSDGTATRARTCRSVSQRLHDRGYYEGYGKTVEERIEHHVAAVTAGCRVICLRLHELPGLGIDPVPEWVVPSTMPEKPAAPAAPPPPVSLAEALCARINAAFDEVLANAHDDAIDERNAQILEVQ